MKSNASQLCLYFACIILQANSLTYPYLKVDDNGAELVTLQIDAPSASDEKLEATQAYDHVRAASYEALQEGGSTDDSEDKTDAREAPNEDWSKNEIPDFPLGTPDEETEMPGEPLTPEDFKNAEDLEILSPPMGEGSPDPIEAAGLFEGDISGVNISEIFDQRNAIRDLRLRWPGGVIPYVISAQYNSYERSVIAAAFIDYHQYTCIRFIPRTSQRDYIHLLKGAGCSSGVGRNGGGQMVSLGPGCGYKGVVVHELMHAAGFWHEQSRQDRDDHINILWHNIQPGLEFNFRKISGRVQQTLGISYDTDSVMHYGMYAFSKSPYLPTIVSKVPGVSFVGQRRGFSQRDLLKVNTLYECGRRPVSPNPIPAPPPPKPDGCVNNNRYCNYWASVGDCRKNPSWMLVNCAKACKQCGVRCGDFHRHCERWAQLHECSKNADYMAVYCPRVCQFCLRAPNDDTACEDHNRHCKAWATSGQCQTNPSYMLKLCKKACKQC